MIFLGAVFVMATREIKANPSLDLVRVRNLLVAIFSVSDQQETIVTRSKEPSPPYHSHQPQRHDISPSYRPQPCDSRPHPSRPRFPFLLPPAPTGPTPPCCPTWSTAIPSARTRPDPTGRRCRTRCPSGRWPCSPVAATGRTFRDRPGQGSLVPVGGSGVGRLGRAIRRLGGGSRFGESGVLFSCTRSAMDPGSCDRLRVAFYLWNPWRLLTFDDPNEKCRESRELPCPARNKPILRAQMRRCIYLYF